jgi:hypothetical protein
MRIIILIASIIFSLNATGQYSYFAKNMEQKASLKEEVRTSLVKAGYGITEVNNESADSKTEETVTSKVERNQTTIEGEFIERTYKVVKRSNRNQPVKAVISRKEIGSDYRYNTN